MSTTFRKCLTATLVASAFSALAIPSAAIASEAEILKRIDALQAEINALKAEAAKAKTAAPVAADKSGPVATSNATGITIYGRLDVVGEQSDDGQVSRQVLQSISSRIGFRGERKLSDDLSGIMQIETGLDPHDETNSKTFASRNSYAGLRSKAFGTLITGKHDTPFKNLEGTASPVWGSAEAMEIIIHGKGSARVANDSKTSLFNNFHTRRTNSVQYWSPKFSSMQVKLAYSPDEISGAAGTYDAKLYGASFEYDNGMFTAGVATETQTNYNIVKTVGYDMTGVKATAGMRFGDGTVGLAYSILDNDLGKKTNNWLLTGTYKFGPTILKGNYGTSSESANGANDGLSMFGIELDYPLDKFTTVYGYYTSISNDPKARGRFEAGETKYSPIAGDDPSVLGLGLRYNF